VAALVLVGVTIGYYLTAPAGVSCGIGCTYNTQITQSSSQQPSTTAATTTASPTVTTVTPPIIEPARTVQIAAITIPTAIGANASTVNGTVPIVANVTDTIFGPQGIVNVTYRIFDSEGTYKSGAMVRTGVWTWQAFWDSRTVQNATGGPYMLTVTGTNTDDTATSKTVTFFVDNSGLQPLSTYYVNYLADPSGDFGSGWSQEYRFLAGETIGVRAPVDGAAACGPTDKVQVFDQSNIQNVAAGVLAPGILPWECTPGDGYVYARATFSGIPPSMSSPPPVGTYFIHIPYNDTSGATKSLQFPFRIVRLGVGWTVVNGFDHADVIAALTLGGEAPLLDRAGTIRGHAAIGQSNTPVSSYVDDNGVVDIPVPYYAWQSAGVTFQLTYTSTNYPIVDTSEHQARQQYPYTSMGISSSTIGQDYVETIHLSSSTKTTPQTPLPAWMTVQIPETNQWNGTAASSGAATFTVTVTPPPRQFSVQLWAYALDSDAVYANQYSNLKIVTEHADMTISGITAKLTNGQLQVNGTATLNTSTMNLSNVQVAVTATDQNGNTVATGTLTRTFTAGQPTPITVQLNGLTAHGTYTVTITATYLPTGWTIENSTTTVTV
jgi:hypothetical protein